MSFLLLFRAIENNPIYVIVRVGSSKKAEGGQFYKVKSVIPNKKYNPNNLDWDFALLELEDSIVFSEKAQPIKLVDAEQKLTDNTKCLVTGWGDTKSSDESNSILRGAEIPIVNQKKCQKYYSPNARITARMLCAGLEEGGKDSCQGTFFGNKKIMTIFGSLVSLLTLTGDSGGPLVLIDDNKHAVQVGVVSWGYGCAQPSYPGIYARITEARDWIYENTGI